MIRSVVRERLTCIRTGNGEMLDFELEDVGLNVTATGTKCS